MTEIGDTTSATVDEETRQPVPMAPIRNLEWLGPVEIPEGEGQAYERR